MSGTFMKRRRANLYSIAGAIVLVGSMLTPLSTPQWYGISMLSVAGVLAGCALFFEFRDRKAGVIKGTTGAFVLATLLLLLTLLSFLPLVAGEGL